MVTYDFYKNAYLGSAIPENAFSGVAAKAEAVLGKMKRMYEVSSDGEISESLAVCAMAEALYAHRDRRGGIIARDVGQVSVRYESEESSDRALSRELMRRACIYLDIYRGVA